ncbi:MULTISPECIES: sialate O-acetylesterase [Prevotella]|nr:MULTISPECIES: sialate O-acetylesterase [Prevotella]
MSTAKVRLSHLISDHMILQQQTDVCLWGWAQPGQTVKVTTRFFGKPVTQLAKADTKGQWLVSVKTPKAGYKPYTITFDDGQSITTVSNVLVGEVWVCAGQSNMEMPMKGFVNCPIEGYNQEVVEARRHKAIHYVKIPGRMSMTPQADADCQWSEINPQTIGDCSATGYFFAQTVNRTLDIPVGLVLANKGGTRIESWLDRDYLKKHTQEPLDSMAMVKRFASDYHRPLLWGNGTFAPILNYTVKGILYYQGCSNVGDPAGQYTQRLQALVEQWRRDFRQGQLPFYFVQIAPHWYDNRDGDWGAKLREQQYNASLVIPNSGIICTDDLVYPYESKQIHPARKRQVGERLAFQALNKTYGMKEIWCESPSFKSMTIYNDTCYVRLQNLYGAISRFNDIDGFEVAGADKVFHKAKAWHYWISQPDPRNDAIAVFSPDVRQPLYVRYAFRNWGYGNMKNGALLPLFPFRTDKDE